MENKPNITDAIDSRFIVDSLDKLTDLNQWQNKNGDIIAYLGMITVVKGDKAYILNELPVTEINNWQPVGSGASENYGGVYVGIEEPEDEEVEVWVDELGETSQIIDSLNSENANDILSANMGRELNERLKEQEEKSSIMGYLGSNYIVKESDARETLSLSEGEKKGLGFSVKDGGIVVEKGVSKALFTLTANGVNNLLEGFFYFYIVKNGVQKAVATHTFNSTSFECCQSAAFCFEACEEGDVFTVEVCSVSGIQVFGGDWISTGLFAQEM